jgi:hypothetical protein
MKPAEEKPLPVAPSWDELKADAAFQKWHASPYLRLMTAALRKAYPVSTAIEASCMIRDAGAIGGYLMALGTVDDFCLAEENVTDKPKSVPYAASTPLD